MKLARAVPSRDPDGHGGDQAILGGYGWPEPAGAAERCSAGGCRDERSAPTDLYCYGHDRFLPLVSRWTNAGRAAVIVLGAALIYGCFALAAQIDSWVPVFVIYGLFGLGVACLPLRHYTRTLRVTIVVWVAACGMSVIYRAAGSDLRAVLATVTLTIMACGFAAHAGTTSVRDVLRGGAIANPLNRPASAVAFGAVSLAVAVAAAMTSAALLLVPRSLLAGGPAMMLAVLAVLALAVALALACSVVAGLVDGIPRIDHEVKGFGPWPGPPRRTWQAERTTVRRRRIRTIVDRLGEASRLALIRLGDALRIACVATARASANLIAAALRLAVNAALSAASVVYKLIVLTCRAMAAGLKSATWILAAAAKLCGLRGISSLTAAGLPVTAMIAAAGLAVAAAGETRLYLVSGPIASLLLLACFGAMAAAVLTIGWITLASQPARESRQSARRSASITGPYALLLLAIGGWVVGLPGTLGHGRVHVGWVTITSTAILAAAFAWTQFIRKAPDETRSGPETLADGPGSARTGHI